MLLFDALYESAGQALHVLAVVAFIAVENVPAPHCVHGMLPFVFLYLPATHASHGIPAGPVKPGVHVKVGAGVVALEEGAGVVVVGASVVTVAELGMTVVVRGGVVLELLFRLPASERRDGRQRKRRAKATRCHAFDRGLGGGETERPGDGTRLTGSASPIRGCWCCKIAPSADLPAFKVWVAVNPKVCQAL